MFRSPANIFVFFAAAAVIGVLFRLYADRTERGRRIARQMYSDERVPQFLRNALPLVPLWASASVLLGVSAVLPPPLGAWLSLSALVLWAATFALSYRTPAPFLPSWLRKEVAEGRTPAPRPTSVDWLLFWLVLAVATLGNAAGVVYLVSFPPR